MNKKILIFLGIIIILGFFLPKITKALVCTGKCCSTVADCEAQLPGPPYPVCYYDLKIFAPWKCSYNCTFCWEKFSKKECSGLYSDCAPKGSTYYNWQCSGHIVQRQTCYQGCSGDPGSAACYDYCDAWEDHRDCTPRTECSPWEWYENDRFCQDNDVWQYTYCKDYLGCLSPGNPKCPSGQSCCDINVYKIFREYQDCSDESGNYSGWLDQWRCSADGEWIQRKKWYRGCQGLSDPPGAECTYTQQWENWTKCDDLYGSWSDYYCKPTAGSNCDVYKKRQVTERSCNFSGVVYEEPSCSTALPYWEEQLVQDCGDKTCGAWTYYCKPSDGSNSDVWRKRNCTDRGCEEVWVPWDSGMWISQCYERSITEDEKVSECGNSGTQCCNSNCGWQTADRGCTAGPPVACYESIGACTDCGYYTCSGGACTTTCSQACGAPCDSNDDCPGTQTCGADCTCKAGVEDCANNIDDDMDGKIDCQDPDCPAPSCGECKHAVCSEVTYDWSCVNDPDGSNCSGSPGKCCSGVCDNDGISGSGYHPDCRAGPQCIAAGNWAYVTANEGQWCGSTWEECATPSNCDVDTYRSKCSSGNCSGTFFYDEACTTCTACNGQICDTNICRDGGGWHHKCDKTCTGNLSCTGWTNCVDHCTNGVKDCDEEEVDCGGSCSPCNTAPTATNLSATTQGSFCCGVTGYPPVILQWQYYDDDGNDQSDYQVQIATDSDFDNIVYNFKCSDHSGTCNPISPSPSTVSHNPTTLVWAATYYWRVKVWDSQGAQSDCPPFPEGWCYAGGDPTLSTFTTISHPYPYVDFDWSPQFPTKDVVVQFCSVFEEICTTPCGLPCTCGMTTICSDTAPSYNSRSICYKGIGNTDYNYCNISTYGGTFLWTIDPVTSGTFAEGTNANSFNPKIKFTGTTVTLSITDASGYGSCSETKTIEIALPLPKWKEIKPFKM